MKSESDKVIKMYLLLTGLFTLSASLIWGINTLFLLGAGVDIFQVFLINAIYAGSMAVFEIPTGIFADTLGRKMSFVSGSVVLMLGTLAYVYVSFIDNNFIYFCIASGVLGFAFTFYSGAVEAWIVDALKFTGYKESLDGVFSKGSVVSSLSMLVGTVSGGIIGTWDLRGPYVLRSIILLVVSIVALVYMKDLGFNKRDLEIKKIPMEMKKIAIESFRYGLQRKSPRKLMMISFVFSTFMMWGWYAWQPHFLNLFGDKEAVWVAGIIAALISLSMAAGSFILPRVLPFFKRRTKLLIFTYTVQSLAILVVGFSNSFYLAVLSYLVFAFLLGLGMPAKQSYLHGLIPSSQRATIISFDSLIGSTGSVIGQTGLGALSKEVSIASGYIVGGFVTILIVPILFMLKKADDPQDFVKNKDDVI